MAPPKVLAYAHALRLGRSSHVLERQTRTAAARLDLLLRQMGPGRIRCRFQSNLHTPDPKSNASPPPKNGSRPKTITRPTFGQIMRALFNVRSLINVFKPGLLKKLYRQNPEELVLALVLVACGFGVLVYVTYLTYFYYRQFTRYPPEVAKALRRALYYSNYSPDAKLALKYYKIALERCEDANLDLFSDDVLGIKIQLAAWLESVGNFDNAASVLETLLSECRRWVGVMEASVRDGTKKEAEAEAETETEAGKGQGNGQGNGQELEIRNADAEPEPAAETLWGKRTRLLGKAVGISIKLGSLYSSEYMRKNELAHERLQWGVETVLAELIRRSIEGLRDGEGEWMTPDAIGATLESLGHSYEAKSQFDLAIPLFFQALQLCRDPCHQAVLMNNLAVSYAQHPLRPTTDPQLMALALGEETKPSTSTATPMSPAETRAAYLAVAERWARHAHELASAGTDRPAECAEACAAALCSLGDIAQLGGDAAAARQWFQQAAQVSEKMGFEPGLTQAEKGLRALAEAAGKRTGTSSRNGVVSAKAELAAAESRGAQERAQYRSQGSSG